MTTATTTHPLLEVRAYRKPRNFETDAQKRVAAGWTLAGQSGDSGHVGLAGATAGYLVAGVPGMLGMQGMRKGKTIVTWVHPNPTPMQIRACKARRGQSKAAGVWAAIALLSLVAGFAIPPLLIVTLIAFCFMAGAMWQNKVLQQRY